jgi:hypothetical protein
MLINLESHINMKHTQTRSREREEEEKYIRKKKGGPSRSDVVILNPKQTCRRRDIYHDKKSDLGNILVSFATLNIRSIKSFDMIDGYVQLKNLCTHTPQSLSEETSFSLCCVS